MLRILLSSLILVLLFQGMVSAEFPTVLHAGVSLVNEVPSALIGTWRVSAKLKTTDSPANFKQTGIDIWNLSREDDVINLSNPFTGASASINVSYVKKNSVKFTKVGDYNNQKLTDSVEISINDNSFTGVNKLTLITYSQDKKTVESTKTALYTLYGEKISGASIIK